MPVADLHGMGKDTESQDTLAHATNEYMHISPVRPCLCLTGMQFDAMNGTINKTASQRIAPALIRILGSSSSHYRKRLRHCKPYISNGSETLKHVNNSCEESLHTGKPVSLSSRTATQLILTQEMQRTDAAHAPIYGIR